MAERRVPSAEATGPSVLVLGEALVDLVVDPAPAPAVTDRAARAAASPVRVEAALGGGPFNTARACGRLGVAVAFVGAISTDRFGRSLTEQLVHDGVDVSGVHRVDVPTTLALAELDGAGTASYRFYVEGTSAPQLGVVDPVTSSVAVTGGLALVLEPMADRVVEAVGDADDRTLVMVDVNCRPHVIADRDAYLTRLGRLLARTDVVKVSDEDLDYLAPGASPMDTARSLLRRGPAAVLVTRGASEVSILTRAGERSVPAAAVAPDDLVDTIGAGDSFGGAFVSWWVTTRHDRHDLADVDALEAGARAATVVAALVCTRRGADPPWLDELPPEWVTASAAGRID